MIRAVSQERVAWKHRSSGSARGNLSPMLRLRILYYILATHPDIILKQKNAPLNFLSGIIESSNLSSSFMMTFLLLPSPITRRVLPQLKSSMHQNEYIGRKKLYTGYLKERQVQSSPVFERLTKGGIQPSIRLA